MIKKNGIFNNLIVKTIFKIVSWIILTFLVLIAALLIYNVVSSKIYEIRGKKYEPFISLYTIISPSMEPNINVYDVVITVKETDYSKIKEGDIITFISTSSVGEGLTITHRVKNVINTENGVKFRTQGDNNPIPDSSLVSQENVLGKVVFKIPWLGHIQFILQSKGGWLFALLIPALIIVIYDVVKVMRLSNVKQKIDNLNAEPEANHELETKQQELKTKLKDKYNSSNETKLNENEVRVEEQETVEAVEPVKVESIENIDIDMNKVMKNIEQIKNDDEIFDVNKIMANISKLDDEETDNLELPKKK